jgi:cytochrome c oxidase subunit III
MSDVSDALKPPWKALSRQQEGATFGIWVFLASELLFFGSLLLLYAIYRSANPQAFVIAGRETDIWYGTVNTAVLMTSSLTMAVAAQAAEADMRRLAIGCLVATAIFGLMFLVFKGFEYAEDIEKNLVPGAGFALKEPAAQIFFALYWIMTAIHAIHLTVGLGLVGRLAIFGAWRVIPLRENPQVEVTALYWHLVDVIWIILYPLIYLMGRS